MCCYVSVGNEIIQIVLWHGEFINKADLNNNEAKVSLCIGLVAAAYKGCVTTVSSGYTHAFTAL